MELRFSAPGKCILMGEHAAVYGRPALVAAIDRRLEVRLTAQDHGVSFDLPHIGCEDTLTWRQIDAYADHVRELWCAYDADPDPAGFRRVRGDDPAHLVKVALAEAATWLGDARPAGLRLHIDSQIPIGSGFGSSAATAVAVASAYLAWQQRQVSAEQLHHIVQEAERRQHGRPSGVDAATVINGGVVWAQKRVEGSVEAVPVEVASPLLEHLRVYDSGAPNEATGDVVAAVARRISAARDRYELLLDRMAASTHDLRRELERSTEDPDLVITLIRRFEADLEELGVVPAKIRAVIRQVERHGGAAKVSGAGTLTGDGAGSLLVYHRQPEQIVDWPCLRDLEPLRLTLGGAGVYRKEETSAADRRAMGS